MASDPNFYELYDGPETDTQGNAVRRFRVPASSEMAARAYFNVDPLMPTVGQAHPRDPALQCSTITVGQRHGTDSWEVVATYMIPGTSLNFNPTDKTSPGTKWLELGFSFRQVDVPYFVKQSVKVPAPPGSPPSVSTVDQVTAGISIKIPVRQITYARIVNVPFLAGGDDTLIGNQLGKIHTFPNGRKYLFTGASSTQSRIDQTQIRYEWVYESDTDLTSILSPVSNDTNYITMIPVNGRRVLPAYWGFIIGKSLVGNPVLPFVDIAPLYESVPGGYTTLPGSPIP